MAPRLLALDGLRGSAALLIAAYHAWLLSGEYPLGGGPWRDALSSGHLAVSLFFVLSGFVLLWPAAVRGDVGDPVAFLVRRCARLLPAFYVALAIGLLAFPLLVAEGTELRDKITFESGVAHLLGVQNEARLLPGYDGTLGFGVNPVVWTISVELAGSAMLLALAPLFLRRPWPAAALALALAAGTRLALPHLGGSSRVEALVLSSTPVSFADFACGMAAAVVVARADTYSTLRRRAGALAAAAAAGLVALLVLAGGPDGSVARAHTRADALTMAVVPVVVAALCAGVALRPTRILAARPVVWLGTVSYGIFLGHFLVIGLARASLGFGTEGSRLDFLAMEAVVLGGAIVYGWLSWTLVERRAQAWGRRFSSGRMRSRSSSVPQPASPGRAPV